MTRTRAWRTAAGAAAATILALAIAAPVQAKSDDSPVMTMPYYGSKFYDNLVTGGTADYVVFGGTPALAICDGSDESTQIGSFNAKITGDPAVAGSTDRYWTTLEVPVEVFEYSTGGVFDFLAEYCADPGSFEPFATGSATLNVRGSTEYLGGGDFLRYEENSLKGSLRTPAGEAVPVQTFAAFYWVDGPPEEISVSVGGPATH